MWVLWILLGLMGLASLLMLIRRPQAHPDNLPMAELPEVRNIPGQGQRTESAEPPVDLKEAEEDFRRLREQEAAEVEPRSKSIPRVEKEEALPELDLSRDCGTGRRSPQRSHRIAAR